MNETVTTPAGATVSGENATFAGKKAAGVEDGEPQPESGPAADTDSASKHPNPEVGAAAGADITAEPR